MTLRSVSTKCCCHRRTRRAGAQSRIVAALLSIAAAGCDAPPGAGPEPTATFDTLPNGAVLVGNAATGVWGEGEGWQLEPETRIGSLMGSSPEQFGAIIGLEVDALGRIYVADSQASEVRVFESDGSYLRTLGRPGGGPGEFQRQLGMGWGPEGDLWVVDGLNGYVVYDTTGAYVKSEPRDVRYGSYPAVLQFDPAGRLIHMDGIPDPATFPPFRSILVRRSLETASVDTLELPENVMDVFVLSSANGRSMRGAVVPFSPRVVVEPDAEGLVWTGVGDRYRLQRQNFEGDTLLIVEREFTPVPVTEEERALENFEYLTDFAAAGGDVDGSRIPATKPVFESLFTDDSGYLWVPLTPPNDRERSFTADVFDSQGRFLGNVRHENYIQQTPSPVVRGDQFYAVVSDELDVPSVVRFQIRGRQ